MAGTKGRSKRSVAAASALVTATGEQASSSDKDALSSVIYIGHLPFGFYEKAILGYFNQFGKVKRLRVSRSKKTARARGYAFVEFSSSEIAKIVAEAMDGYMLFTQKLSVRVMKVADVHPQLFHNARARLRPDHWVNKHRATHNKEASLEDWTARSMRAVKRDGMRMKAIEAAGIGYEYEGLRSQLADRPKKITFDQ
jgi:nucleolar protein 15